MLFDTIDKNEMDCLLAFADNPGWHSIVGLPASGPISGLIKYNFVTTRDGDRFARITEAGAQAAKAVRWDFKRENKNGR